MYPGPVGHSRAQLRKSRAFKTDIYGNLLKIKVKICGITREEDAHAAVNAGAHALGFVFYRPSSRYIDAERAQAIIDTLPPFVTTVGVMVNQSIEEVESLLKQVSLNLLQLHGDESPQTCSSYGIPYVKAIRVRSIAQAGLLAGNFPDAKALLLDTLRSDVYGGTGESFHWHRLPNSIVKPVILAGGLDANNVGEAIRKVQPYAVDVSSGVEHAKGEKDAAEINKFIDAVRAVELEKRQCNESS